MAIALYSLTSSLHAEKQGNPLEERFIKDIGKALGESFEYFGEDFSNFGTHEADLIYIRTGGTEGLFKELDLKGDIRLLTSGQSNSLAASMEILSYLRSQGQRGEILHGSAETIASELRSSCISDTECGFIHQLCPTDLGGIRLGVIGKPSDWLIASNVDYLKVKNRLNAELIDIPIDELIKRINCPNDALPSFQGSEAIYNALKVLIKDYNLEGLTIRCFDMLDSVHNTACLALAKLNADGIPASCEGDIPALLSMAYLQKTKGCPGFQCNLSRIDGNNLLFAHCTVPLNMLESYSYDTHFESGIGTAIKGELKLLDVEIFKISPDLEHYVLIPGKIVSNSSEKFLCRTQILVNSPGAADYMLHTPLSNHHIVCYK